MDLLLLGVAFGVVTVMVPGPVSMSLIQVASSQGTKAGTHAAAGIAGGDLVLALVGVGLISVGTLLPAAIFGRLQLVSGLILIVFGLLMIMRPSAIQERAAAVSHPARTFLVFTTLVPSALGSWLAILAAMPFAAEPFSLGLFAAGIVASSALWHPILGVSAGTVGPRLTNRTLAITTRFGGVATACVGIWTLV